jgi:hypothetical protein
MLARYSVLKINKGPQNAYGCSTADPELQRLRLSNGYLGRRVDYESALVMMISSLISKVGLVVWAS